MGRAGGRVQGPRTLQCVEAGTQSGWAAAACFPGVARTRAIFLVRSRSAPLSRESIERLNLGELSLMDFGNPYRDRRSGVVHINMPNIGVDSRK